MKILSIKKKINHNDRLILSPKIILPVHPGGGFHKLFTHMLCVEELAVPTHWALLLVSTGHFQCNYWMHGVVLSLLFPYTWCSNLNGSNSCLTPPSLLINTSLNPHSRFQASAPQYTAIWLSCSTSFSCTVTPPSLSSFHIMQFSSLKKKKKEPWRFLRSISVLLHISGSRLQVIFLPSELLCCFW